MLSRVISNDAIGLRPELDRVDAGRDDDPATASATARSATVAGFDPRRPQLEHRARRAASTPRRTFTGHHRL